MKFMKPAPGQLEAFNFLVRNPSTNWKMGHKILTWLSVCVAVICQAQKPNMRHLNMKINRLNRITNVLQKDVEDIWTAISTSGMTNQDFENQTSEELETKAEHITEQVNGTAAHLQDLKTEVEHLIVYSRNGMASEKKLQRETIRNLEKGQQEFRTQIAEEQLKTKQDLKRLDDAQTGIQETHKTYQIKMENITQDFRDSINKNKNELEVHHGLHENMSNILETISLKQDSLETENQKENEELAGLKQQLSAIIAFLSTCNEGWTKFGDNCYLSVNVKQTWDQALAFCQSKSGYLVEIATDEEAQFVGKLLGDPQSGVFWIGASDRASEGTFVWEKSKQKVLQKYWNPGEPNNVNGVEHCAVMFLKVGVWNNHWKFNDVPCGDTWTFVCEKSLPFKSP